VNIGPPILIAIVAAAIRIAFFQHAPVFFEGDARGYLIRALELSSGQGFQFSLKRTPGYPLVMAAIFDVVAEIQLAEDNGLFAIYPNPATDKLTIQKSHLSASAILSKTALQISIYNMLGEMVLNAVPEFSNKKQQAIIDVQGLAKGIFWIEINSDDKVYRRKFVKE
jgi:hypothetical protein